MNTSVYRLSAYFLQSLSSATHQGLGSRAYSSASKKGRQPNLKSQLRELYKLIHPDLFQEHPPARQENERSFKLLQEYLEAGKKGVHPAAAALPYSFKFFLRKGEASPPPGQDLGASEAGPFAPRQSASQGQPQAGLQGNAASQQVSPAAARDAMAAEAMGLQCVALLLPPPAPSPSDALTGELSRSSRRGLVQILRACGLEAGNSSDDSSDLPGVADGKAPASLRAFLPAAAEAARQRQGAQMGPRHQLSILRTALRLGRKVAVTFGEEARQAGAVKQAELLGMLSAALDLVKDVDVAGVQFGFDGWDREWGIDHTGTVWLPMDAGPLTLTGFLRQLDVEEVKSRQAALAQLQRLEAAVAARAGLGMLYCTPGLQLQPTYTRFLERLAAFASDQGPCGEGECGSIPLCILPSAPAADHQEPSQRPQEGTAQASDTRSLEERGFAVNEEMGFLAAAVDATPKEIYAHVQEHQGHVSRLQMRKADQAQKMDNMRAAVERRLRLRLLQRDPSLPAEQFLSCCSRMITNSTTLINLIESQAVRVSHVNHVPPDGSQIDIAWDFEL